MSFIETSDDIIDNSSKLLNDVINSKFAQFLQGNGSPILTTYYHLDDTMSTTESGSNTVDDLIGRDSPLMYNKITGFPVCGLKDLLPEKDALDGGLIDLSLDADVVIFPNTIKPNGLDYLLYVFPDNPDTHILFKVTDFEFSSIRNNSYYKLSLSLKEFNNWSYIEKLDKQVVREYRTNMDKIGTLDRCIIEDTTYEQIEKVDFACEYLIREYLDLFYDSRYNALLFREDPLIEYPVFDPFLTTFIIQNKVLDIKDTSPYVLINYDYRDKVKRTYNKTLYRNLELHDRTQVYMFHKVPASFTTTETNPFAYYGEEVVFSLDLFKHDLEETLNCEDRYYYHHKRLIEGIMSFRDFKPFEEPASKILIPDIVNRNYTTVSEDATIPPNDSNDSLLVNRTFDIGDSDYDEIMLNDMDDNVSDEIQSTNEDIVIDDVTNQQDDNINDSNNSLDNVDDETNLEEDITDDTNVILTDLPTYCNIIVRYLGKSNLYQLVSIEELEKIVSYDMDYNYENFMYIPIIIFILKKYKMFLINNK